MKKISKPIIMFDGLAASGKTTLARHLAEQTNSTVINGDTFMAEAIYSNADVLSKRFGSTPELGKYRQYVQQIITDQKSAYDFMEYVRPTVEGLISVTQEYLHKDKVEKISPDALYNYSTDTNAYIVDFITTSAFSYLWQDADKRYIVLALLEKILSNAKERGRPDDEPKVVENKFYARMPVIMRAKKTDLVVFNQYATRNEFLEESSKLILPQIKELI